MTVVFVEICLSSSGKSELSKQNNSEEVQLTATSFWYSGLCHEMIKDCLVMVQ